MLSWVMWLFGKEMRKKEVTLISHHLPSYEKHAQLLKRCVLLNMNNQQFHIHTANRDSTLVNNTCPTQLSLLVLMFLVL